MPNVTTAQPLPNPDLAKLALNATDWDASYLGSKYPAKVLRDTAEAVEHAGKVPLAHLEPKLDGSLSAPVKAHLSTIIASIRPTLSPEQTSAWVNAVMIKMADIAPIVLKQATAAALHVAFEFEADVETKVRELAASILSARGRAVARLNEAAEKASDTRTGGTCLTPFEFERQAFAKRRDATCPDQIEDAWAWERHEQIKMGRTVQRLLPPMDRDDIERGIRFGWLEKRNGQLIEHNVLDGKPIAYRLDTKDFPVLGTSYRHATPVPMDLRKDEE